MRFAAAVKAINKGAVVMVAALCVGVGESAKAWGIEARAGFTGNIVYVIEDVDISGLGNPVRYVDTKTLEGKRITAAKMDLDSGRVRVEAVHVLTGEKLLFVLPQSAFTPLRSQGVQTKAGETSIPVSNDGDSFDVSCDGRFAVVVGANSATPVTLVDLGAGKQVATVAYANKLARAAAIGDDGSSVLVVLDNPTNNNANAIRRLVLGTTGTLVDAGEQLFLGTDYVTKVRIAPGSKIGVALVSLPARIVAFRLPGLTVTGSVTLASTLANGIALSPSGDRIYARSGNRGGTPDVIQGFAFDPVNGTIGQASVLSIGNVAGFTGLAYHDPIAVSNDGARLIVAEESFSQPPAGRIAEYSTSTGALVDTLVSGLDRPQIVATVPGCGAQGGGGTETLVEFNHAAFGHYFVTGIAAEIAALDSGAQAGWARTGERFGVHRSGTPNTAVTCRFFSGGSFAPKSSHFYTPYASECTTVKADPTWQFEGEVFNVALPGANGSCTPPSTPLYRVYNNGQGGAPNHRYTTRLDLHNQMIASGWSAEGLGPGVIACVPPAAAVAQP